jgi:hypothetical protein
LPIKVLSPQKYFPVVPKWLCLPVVFLIFDSTILSLLLLIFDKEGSSSNPS